MGKTMDNVDNCSIIFAVIICNFGIIQNELCAEINQIWLRINSWKNSKQIWQYSQLRWCPLKYCIHKNWVRKFCSPSSINSLLNWEEMGSEINWIICLRAWQEPINKIEPCSDDNSGLLAIESFIARRERLQFFGINFLRAKTEFLTCIKLHDQ